MYEGIDSLNLVRQPAWKTAIALVGLALSAVLMAVLLLVVLWRNEPNAPAWTQAFDNGTYVALWFVEVALVAGSLWFYRRRKQIVRV